jgi:hypothetical protein
MGEFAGSGRTVLFVSHQMAAVTHLCNRAIWLETGNIRQAGDSKIVVEDYLNEQLTGPDEILTSMTLPLAGRGLQLNEFDCKIVQGHGDGAVDLRLIFGCELDQPVRNFGVGIEIRTEDDILVGKYSPSVTGMVADLEAGENFCTVLFPALGKKLASGRYSVSFWFARQRQEVLLSVDRAAVFEIPERDDYGSGVAFHQRIHGAVKLPLSVQFGAKDI